MSTGGEAKLTHLIYFFALLNFLLVLGFFAISSYLNLFKYLRVNESEVSECGANRIVKQLPFSIRFFVVILVFLVFDVELFLVLPFFMLPQWVAVSLLLIDIPLILYLILSLAYE